MHDGNLLFCRLDTAMFTLISRPFLEQKWKGTQTQQKLPSQAIPGVQVLAWRPRAGLDVISWTPREASPEPKGGTIPCSCARPLLRCYLS
jgi:hypothetical protein